ncbi:MAG: hypothetical protein Q9170_006775 [Blastenia crenularia]
MSQQAAAKSVRTTLTASSWRSKESVLRGRGTDSSTSTSVQTPAWRALVQDRGVSTLQPPSSIPSIAEESTSSNRPPANAPRGPASQVTPRRQGSSRYNHQPPSVLNPPSAAAVSRAASYNPYQRPPSYSRSHLPDPEKDYFRVRREANQGMRLRKEDYKPGMIIRAPLHEQDSRGDSRSLGAGSNASVASASSEATLAEKYTTPSRFGTIFTKYRKMIVVACHQDNYVAIPLYTHNGKGLIHKARPDEFVSVRDHRDKDKSNDKEAKDEWQRLSKWEPLVTEYVKEGIDIFERKTTAHLAYPVSRRYALPVVNEGWLRGSSLRVMRDLYGRFAGVDV